MNYVLEGLGSAIWIIIIMKSIVEFKHTLCDYDNDIFVGESIIRTHQNLSGLIFIMAAAASTFLAEIQHAAILQTMYGKGLWVTALLVRLMFLYQVEMYSQERTTEFSRVGIVKMFKIKFKNNYGKINGMDKE